MRRLITSRGVQLALAATAVAVIIAIIMRFRRSPARQDPAHHDTTAETSSPAQAESEPVSQWPPVPVLGVPTAEDLKRYAVKPSAFRTALEGFFRSPPREPLDEATRRRLNRWGIAGLALLLLAGGTQALEAAVFSKGTGMEASEQAAEFREGPCTENVPDHLTTCFVADTGWTSTPNNDGLPQPTPDGEAQEPVPDYGPTPDADCHPKSGAPEVRPINPKVTRAVNRQWRRIETWLKINAPRSYRTLGKPGNAETIAAAEAHMGLRFPDDLRASLLRHDGAVYLTDTWAFGFLGDANLGIQGIRDTWQQLCEIDAEDVVEGEFSDRQMQWWDGRMIPFSADGMGDHLVIDSVKRDVGDTDHEGSMNFTPAGIRIRSYYALLKATADALETGDSIGYMKPKPVDGELEWEVL
ncbi:SMI1/KNR4 family protein [Streptosporangium fragile]|uniref:SMI1/KNR4 family protein n=1 Tax=Streptosporangium fragile TaxID=46186 RepID=UPI0031EBA2B4